MVYSLTGGISVGTSGDCSFKITRLVVCILCCAVLKAGIFHGVFIWSKLFKGRAPILNDDWKVRKQLACSRIYQTGKGSAAKAAA